MKESHSHTGHSHPHPSTFQSAGDCKIEKQGMHFHLEAAADDGTIDTTRANVYTRKEQNALVWLVYRNRSQFPLENKTALCVIAVPDVGPENTDYPEDERNLGSESCSLLKKVYALFPSEGHTLYANFFDKVNQTKGWDKQIAMLRECITIPVKNLVPVYEKFRDMKGVKGVLMYAITYEQTQHLISMHDQLFEVLKKRKKGTGNATSCVKITHENFPKITGVAPEQIKNKVITIFDSLSEALPKETIFFNEPNKQSKGGWRIWKTNQENIFVATLYATPSNEINGAKVVEILMMTLNAMGIATDKLFNPDIKKHTAVVAFDCETLQRLDVNKVKAALVTGIRMHKMPDVGRLVENSTVNSPVHTSVKSTTGAAVSKSVNPGNQKRFEKK